MVLIMLTGKDKRRIVLKVAGCAGLAAITGLAISSLVEDFTKANEEPEETLYLEAEYEE